MLPVVRVGRLCSGTPLLFGFLALLTGLLLLGGPSAAWAYTKTGYSLEWLCEFSPVVVQVRQTGGEGGFVECKPVKVFKGKADEVIRFQISAGPKKGTDYLLFLSPGEKGAMEVRYWVNLDQPDVEKRPGFVIINKGGKGPGLAINKKGDLLTDRDIILRLVGERLKATPLPHAPSEHISRMAQSLRIPAPGESASALWQGSVAYLLVPPDPEFKKTFVERFAFVVRREKDHFTNFEVASKLGTLTFYPEKDVISLLKKALADEGHSVIVLRKEPDIGFPGQTVQLYPVRQAAYEALTAMGEKVAKPEHFCEYFFLGWGSYGFRDPRTGRIIGFDVKKPVGGD